MRPRSAAAQDAAAGHPAVRVLAVGGGAALAVAFAAAARARGAKPIHSRGVVRRGLLEVNPLAAPRTGVPLLDEPAQHPVLVRTSRSVGLPAPVPDVLGIAVRIHSVQAGGDLLFASTGAGRLTRHCLVPRRGLGGGPLSTLLPVPAPVGPLLLGLFPRSPAGQPADEFDLRWSAPGGPWRGVGLLRLGAPVSDETDPPVRFDPVLHAVPGMQQYPALATLRALAYAGARRGFPVPTRPDLE